jgi:EmrB/QacA subfamily drug resistance transporter
MVQFTMSDQSQLKGSNEPPALTRRQVTLTLAGVMLAMFISALNQTVVATAMPRIITDLGGFSQYAWVSTSFLITSTVVVPITGKLTDMYGRKFFYVLGIAIFTLGSLLCGFSQSMAQIIVFRGLQGLGAGVMMTNAFTVIADIFPPQERGKYTGLLSSMFGLSSIVGPTLGGFITDALSWSWVFWVNVPLGMVALLMFLRFFPNLKISNVGHKIDYWGITTLTLAVVSLMLALSWGGAIYSWSSPVIVGLFACSVATLIIFITIETRVEEPVIPFSLFKNRTVAISLIITLIAGAGMFGAVTYVPLFFQGVMGVSATASGSFITPMMLGTVFGALISGQLLSRAGGRYKLQGGIGIALNALGLGLLSRLTLNTSYSTSVIIIAVAGFGQGICLVCYSLAVQNSVPNRILGVATSTSLFFRSIGGALGIAVFGSIMTNRFTAEFVNGLTEGVKAAVPQQQITSMVSNPQVLVNPASQNQLRSVFDSLGPQGSSLFGELFLTLREALSSALSLVFLIGMAVVLIALVLNFFFKNPADHKLHDRAP